MLKKLKLILKIPLAIVQLLIIYLPGQVGHKVRYWYWKRRLKYLGKQVKIDVGVYFQNPEYISIDDHSWIDRGVNILAGPNKSNRAKKMKENNLFELMKGEVWIGKQVHIGTNSLISGIGGVFISDLCCLASSSKIYSFSHHYKSLVDSSKSNVHFGSCGAPEDQFMIEGPVFLGENVGVGLNTVILPGTSIENNSFVAIGSIVYDSFPKNSFIRGNPAKRIKPRFDPPEERKEDFG